MYEALGQAQTALENFPEAATYYETVARLEPGQAHALVNWAIAVAQGGDPRRAVEIFRDALAIDPNSSTIYANLGTALIEAGEEEEGRERLERALAINPEDPIALQTLEGLETNPGVIP